MKFFAFLLIVTFVSGCGIASDARLAGHRDDYQNCLRKNNGDDSKCVTEKKIFEADIAARSSSRGHGTVCTTSTSGRVTTCN